MQDIEPADKHRLNAAEGWLGFGKPDEARAELAGLSPKVLSHPDVLEMRWLICAHENNWREGLAVADSEIAVAPQMSAGWLHRAYAMRRVEGGGIARAWDILYPAADKFPEQPVIAYNLSCYACQLNKPDEARRWLQRAIETAGVEVIKKMALADDDLRPLWPEIEKL